MRRGGVGAGAVAATALVLWLCARWAGPDEPPTRVVVKATPAPTTPDATLSTTDAVAADGHRDQESVAPVSIRGFCVDERLVPLSLVAVAVVAFESIPPTTVTQTTSSTDGSFALTCPPDARRLGLRLTSPDTVPRLEALPLPLSDSIDLGRIVLHGGIGVDGIVRDEHGGPVGDAQLRWALHPTVSTAGPALASEGSAHVDDVGRFNLGRLPPGTLSVTVTGSLAGAPACGMYMFTLVSHGGENRFLTLTITPAEPRRVLAVSAIDGAPVAGVMPYAVDLPSQNAYGQMATATGSRPGEVLLYVPSMFAGRIALRARGFRAHYLHTTANQLDLGTARLHPGSDEVRVALDVPQGTAVLAGVSLASRVASLPGLRPYRTDDSGGISVSGSPFRIDAGQRICVVEPLGQRSGMTRPLTVADFATDAPAVLCPLTPIPAVHVQCVDATSGLPVPAARVLLFRDAGTGALLSTPWGYALADPAGTAALWSAVSVAVTDNEGRAELRTPLRMPMTLAVECRGYATAYDKLLVDVDQDKVIRLGAEAVVDARVLVPDGTVVADLALLDFRRGRVLKPDTIDRDGCVFRGVGVGAYLLGPRQLLSWALDFSGKDISAFEAVAGTRVVRVSSAGQTVQTTVELPEPGWLSATIITTAPNGSLMADLVPEPLREKERAVRPVAVMGNELEIGPLIPGSYALRLFLAGGRVMSVHRIDVQPGKRSEVTLRVPWVRCVVIGKDVGGYLASLRRDDGAPAASGSGGQVSLEVPPGLYQLDVRRLRDDVEILSKRIELEPGVTTVEVE